MAHLKIAKLIVTFVFEPQWDNNYVTKLPCVLEYKVTPPPPIHSVQFPQKYLYRTCLT
jgi:hypothetical protein